MKYSNSDMLLNENELSINMSMTSYQDYSFESSIKNIDGNIINGKINDENESENGFEKNNEELIKKKFEIPMNKKEISKNNKISREMTFSDENNYTTKVLKSKNFCICSNEMITTYLLNLFIFSEFTNPKNIEKNENVNVYYVLRNNILDKFYYNSHEIVKNLNLSSDKESKIKEFFKEMNNIFKSNDYLSLKNQNNSYRKTIKIFFIILILIFIISIIIFIFMLHGNNSSPNKEIIIGIYIFFLIIIGLFFYIIINKYNDMDLNFIYNDIIYMISKNKEINSIIDKWNKSDFESMRIHVSVPISLKYIQFNLDLFQNIEIKHLEMDKIKNSFYHDNRLSEENYEEFKILKKNLNYYL